MARGSFLRGFFYGTSATWDYRDPVLRSPAIMAAKPICSTMDHTYEGWKVSNLDQQQNNIACTMMHRLCHLIFRLETSMC